MNIVKDFIKKKNLCYLNSKDDLVIFIDSNMNVSLKNAGGLKFLKVSVTDAQRSICI